MIETWFQWTCNGCGVTEFHPSSCVLKSEVRAFLKSGGWQHFKGDLDYCRIWVADGRAARRDTSMGEDPAPKTE